MDPFKRRKPIIGDRFQGGKIAYIFQKGDLGFVFGEFHGLIIAPEDQSSGISWNNGEYKKTVATGTSIGTGLTNTKEIVSCQGLGNYAAKLCFDLSLDGYDDWFLPSKCELNKLYINRVAISNLSRKFYWSSTQFGYNTACNQHLGDGSQGSDYRSRNLFVRAVRTF